MHSYFKCQQLRFPQLMHMFLYQQDLMFKDQNSNCSGCGTMCGQGSVQFIKYQVQHNNMYISHLKDIITSTPLHKSKTQL